VPAGFRIVGIDGAQQRLEDGGGESFGGQPALSLAQESAPPAAPAASPTYFIMGGGKERNGPPFRMTRFK
jgi:hypothetical protein